MTAERPPMGWNSWDCFGSAVTEEQVRENAAYMAANMKKYGWEYVVVDIEWYQPTADTHEYHPFADLCMDEYGRLQPAENRFPSAAGGAGFTALAVYVHQLGLKFGIHIMRGMPRMAAHRNLPILHSAYTAAEVADPNSICAWNPDMYGLKCEKAEEGARAYYASIFQMYAQWGVDFVKVDDIAREYPHCRREIELISEACRGCGRQMVLSLSPGPAPLEQAEHLKQYANMWRITDDFWDDWKLLLAMFERAEKWCIHAGPGHWPDADMLPVGALRQDYDSTDRTRLTRAEQQTMLSLWCMMRSPLIVGANLPANDAFTLQLLTNREILDIETESAGGHPVYRTDTEIVWMAPCRKREGCYLAVFNIAEENREILIDLAACEAEMYHRARELWTGQETEVNLQLRAKADKHGAAVFYLSEN